MFSWSILSVSLRIRVPAGWLAAAGLGLFAAMVAAPPDPAASGMAVLLKLRSQAPDCPWSRTVTYAASRARFEQLRLRYDQRLAGGLFDQSLPMERVITPKRAFWVTDSFRLADTLAETDWLAEANPMDFVRRGDIVVDLRAGSGVFTSRALEAGADKVVAVEMDRLRQECLRRTFHREIQNGSVVLITDPASLDAVVAGLRLAKVDFIRVGSSDSLAGAENIIRRFHPRLMTEDFRLNVPASYSPVCGPCLLDDARLIPRVVYWR